LHPCSVGFPITYCQGEWNLGPPFGTQIEAAVNRKALHGICKEGNLKGVVLWEVMAAVIWDKKGFVELVTAVNSELLPPILEHWNLIVCLH